MMKHFNGHTKNESILSECLVEGLKLQIHNWKFLAGSCSRVWRGTSRYLQLKFIRENIFTLCVDVNIVTPVHSMKATVGSPGFECTCQFVY